MLASNCFGTGASSLEKYAVESNPEVVDLVLSGLPPSCESHMLKKISGSKHIISATVDEDNFRGVCKGTGRI